MPKHYCINESCEAFQKPVDIDSSFVAYYHYLDHAEFKMVNKKFYCKKCGEELDFPEVTLGGPLIGKYGMASQEEKMNMLRKRSRDLRIPENRIIKQRKDHMDKTGATKYIN